MHPKVSIIIPCYNGSEYLPWCLDSILNQKYENIEVVFVNDGSTEPVNEIISAYKGSFDKKGYELLYLEQDNQGQAAAINLGLRHFTGAYMMWMDADDIILPDNISTKAVFLENNPECGFVLCEGAIVPADYPDKIIGYEKRVPPKGKDTLFQDLIFERNIVYGRGVILVRRDAFEHSFPTGQIIENRVGQNLQLLLPLAYKNTCGYIPEVLFKYVKHEDSHFSQVQGELGWIDHHERIKNLTIEIVESLDSNGSAEYSDIDKDDLIRDIRQYRTDKQMKLALKTGDIQLILSVWLRYKGIEKARFFFRGIKSIVKRFA